MNITGCPFGLDRDPPSFEKEGLVKSLGPMFGDAHSPDWCQMGRQLPSIQNYKEKKRYWQLFVNSEEQRNARNANASSLASKI